jgi:crotonobetainyl-CoA:carnitine CoA-transferase CaiB-like acyl-CoA transferase
MELNPHGHRLAAVRLLWHISVMVNQRMDATALGHLRVVEVGGGAAETAARLMADMGADVVLVEPPEGAPSRRRGPFAKGAEGDPERSLSFIANNFNKRSIALDLQRPEGRETLRQLATWADVLIEAFAPSYLPDLGLGYDDLRKVNPGLVYASLSPFGQAGPYRDLAATELTIQSLAGDPWVYGDDEREPCIIPADATERVGSMHLVLGILLALRARRWTGRGQHVDVSRHDVGVWQLVSGTLSRFSIRHEVYRRPGKSTTGVGSIYRCADGVVQFFPSTEEQFRGLVTKWMQDPTFDDPVWDDPNFRRDNWDLIDARAKEFFATKTAAEIEEEGFRHDVPLARMATMAEFVNHPHTRERGFIIGMEHPALGRYQGPGAPYRFSATPWSVHKPAPRLGEHTQDVLDMLRAIQPAPRPAFIPHSGDRPKQPLEGVRIVDMSRVFAGPFAAMLLAFHGAQVIRVESADLPAFRQPRQPNFAELNRNKLACSIDFRTPKGKELLKRLVSQSDVFIENFRPTVMERLGLGYEELRAARPNLVMISMSGYGKTGPLRDHAAFGQLLMAFSGLSYMWGHPESDLDTRPKNAYSDFVLGVQAAMAVMMGLEHRDRTGQGQHIESSHVEGLAALLGPELLQYLVNGVSPEARGNRSDVYAPHGVHPCRGWDAWVSIAVENDDQWRRMAKAMDEPKWAQDERFSTMAGRQAHREELDRRIGEWTQTRWPQQVQTLLQAAGVPCGAVQNPTELLRDPHLHARGTLVRAHHDPAWWGTLEHPGLSIHLSETPGWAGDSAPTPGQDNDYVFKQLLGLSEDEIERLTAEKVLR